MTDAPAPNIAATQPDIATLIELTAAPTDRLAGISIPGGVVTGSPSPVAAQSVANAQSFTALQPKWLLLGAAWSTFPSAATTADLIEEFVLDNWTIERLQRGYQNPEACLGIF